MRRAIVCLVMSLLLLGCAARLSIVRGLNIDSDTKKVLGVLMEKLERCKPDGEWRTLSIPDKNDKTAQYIIYKHIEKGHWGIAVLVEGSGVMCGYDSGSNIYFIQMGMGPMQINKEDFERNVQDFVKMIMKDGDIGKAARFQLPVEGTKI